MTKRGHTHTLTQASSYLQLFTHFPTKKRFGGGGGIIIKPTYPFLPFLPQPACARVCVCVCACEREIKLLLRSLLHPTFVAFNISSSSCEHIFLVVENLHANSHALVFVKANQDFLFALVWLFFPKFAFQPCEHLKKRPKSSAQQLVLLFVSPTISALDWQIYSAGSQIPAGQRQILYNDLFIQLQKRFLSTTG